MELTAPIVEIFRSLEGEGDAVGTPTIFIRIAGCNVGCKHCDSKQTWNTKKFHQMSSVDILEVVKCLNVGSTVNRISITGGEPLLHLPFLLELCTLLVIQCAGYVLNLETSGTLFPGQLFSPGHYEDYFDMISLDIKTPSSGVKLSEEQRSSLREAAVQPNVYIKAVIGTTKDLDFTLNLLEGLKVNNLILTPCEVKNTFFSVDKIYSALDRRKHDFIKQPLRIIAQQHKLISYR